MAMPSQLNRMKANADSVTPDNLVAFENSSGTTVKEVELTEEQINYIIKNIPILLAHMNDSTIHVTEDDKTTWGYTPEVVSHVNNGDIHVTEYDRDNWNNKETVNGAQTKANVVQTNLNKHQTNENIHITTSDRNKWNNTYSKEDINNLFAQYEYGSDWKESVNTYNDILTTYPNPAKGWTVNTLDTNYTYQFNGTDWIIISGNAMPLASETVDGKMSKEDKAKLNGIENNANNYIHPNNEYCRHVTDDQIADWNSRAYAKLASYDDSGLMSPTDKKKLDNIDEGANYYVLPEEFDADVIVQDATHRFVTDSQISDWDGKAETTLATVNKEGLMSSTDKAKLDTIAEYANNYVLPDSISANKIYTDSGRRFVTDDQIAKWDNMISKDIVIRGTAKFNGMNGTRIVHDLLDPSKSYYMYVIPTSMVDSGTLGNIVIDKGTNEAFVYSTGGNTVDSFDYIIFNI